MFADSVFYVLALEGLRDLSTEHHESKYAVITQTKQP